MFAFVLPGAKRVKAIQAPSGDHAGCMS